MIQQSHIQQFFIKPTINQTSETDSSFNVYSKSMSEQIIKKNYEIIKIFIRRLNEIYCRQEQYDTSSKNTNQKLAKIIDANDNFHYEFRATSLELDRRVTMLTSDILGLKNFLKIPSNNTPFQTYLQSQFFKQHSSQLNTRSRRRITQKNKSIRCLEEEQNFGNQATNDVNAQKKYDFAEKLSNVDLPQVIQNIRRSEEQQLFSQFNEDNSISQRYLNKNYLKKIEENNTKINRELQYYRQRLQKYDQNDQFDQRLRQLQDNFQKRIDEIKNKHHECNWKHIDFDELLKYIDTKVSALVNEKVSKSFFQQSLNNLKQAWENQSHQIYKRLDKKLQYQSFEIFHTKFAEINSQIEQLNNFNVMKIQNISFNTTCKSTPSKQSQTDLAKLFQIAKQTKNEEIKASRHTLNYCSSLSVLRCDQQKKMTFDNYTRQKQQSQILEQKWKDKVTDCLGINKRIKRKKKNI